MNTKKRRRDEEELPVAPKEFDLCIEGTSAYLKLLRSEFIARSEARRLLRNLERLREVVLDFCEVQYVGQGFADEVFRVFAHRNPGVILRHKNASTAVMAMIRHVSREVPADIQKK